jgi:methionine synthase II (cobalamin-independent)
VGAATGVGSLPGTDVREAVRVVLGELPDLPHLPELPARGPGAEMTGRAVALLTDLPAEWGPFGWRLVPRAGRDLHRARSLLAEDLDALEEAAEGYTGPLKVQVCGPWTLAATLELGSGEKALADPGARRDLAASLAEGVAGHLAELRRRVPGADLAVQLDEPSLPAVAEGGVPTVSGFSRLRAVPEPELLEHLSLLLDTVASAGAEPVVHCCASAPPIQLLVQAGARALSVDATLLTADADDALGEALESGAHLLLGTVPAAGPAAGSSDVADAQPARVLGHRLGVPPGELAERMSITPTCGLAGATPAYARAALGRARAAARRLVEDPEGERG